MTSSSDVIFSAKCPQNDEERQTQTKRKKKNSILKLPTKE
jgi:hypothetical protein